MTLPIIGWILVATFMTMPNPGPIFVYPTEAACKANIAFSDTGPQNQCVALIPITHQTSNVAK